MNILYVYTRWTGDEAAITQAFRDLGHHVYHMRDITLYSRTRVHPRYSDYDLIFFNHTSAFDGLAAIDVPKVFWYFDLITHDDPAYKALSKTRSTHVLKAMEISELGFCTDGEWANRCPDKMTWLMQGAQDTRLGSTEKQDIDILFAGTITSPRESFIEGLMKKFGSRFQVANNIYGRDFADLIARSKIVVAPDIPIKSNYWSNRVYMVTGYGGFLFHPCCERLTEHFDCMELQMYSDRESLFELIEFYLGLDEPREAIAKEGWQRTCEEHTYRHRCRKLMEVVQERIFDGVSTRTS